MNCQELKNKQQETNLKCDIDKNKIDYDGYGLVDDSIFYFRFNSNKLWIDCLNYMKNQNKS